MIILSIATISLLGCNAKQGIDKSDDQFQWQVDKFADLRILRYQIPGWEELTLKQKELIYYLGEAALCGRDIIFDQNFKHNLAIRRTLEAIYNGYSGNRETPEWEEFMVYIKRVWFSNGIHHHYSTDKIIPGFSVEYFDNLVNNTPKDLFPNELGSIPNLLATLEPIIFDPITAAKRVSQAEGIDLVATSANNYYEGITQKEAEDFYTKLFNPNDTEPISHGLNSKLIKKNGEIVEQVWKIDGMYGQAIERIVYWLEKAANVAENEKQKEIIETLVKYYTSGDLKMFDKYNILWLKDLDSRVDFVSGFIENYGDPLGHKASWQALVNFKDHEATKRAEIMSQNAQWFEDNSPVDSEFKKSEVKGISAKVINATTLAGDCYPVTPIGINLPNADWIRKEHGSKSVTIQNITYAYNRSSIGDGFIEEFAWDQAEVNLHSKYGLIAGNLHTDLHECLGHGSGQLKPGVVGDELKQYGSTIEECRADLFALYFIMDRKMVKLGIMPNLKIAEAEYTHYIRNGIMTQITRIELGKDIEQAHMRNRQLIARWCYENGKNENVIEKKIRNGKTYFVINDYKKLRKLFGSLLKEIQRIKSTGDFEGAKQLVETYAVKIDQDLHKEVLDRYAKLNIAPYAGFINPVLVPIFNGDEIIDIQVEYPTDYTEQMLNYTKNYSFLPVYN
jgi:dipeptidyl-peptidase-3